MIERRLLVRIDFDANRIYALKRKADLDTFDNADGVDVELTWGPEIAVDQFLMSHPSEYLWRYQRDDSD